MKLFNPPIELPKNLDYINWLSNKSRNSKIKVTTRDGRLYNSVGPPGEKVFYVVASSDESSAGFGVYNGSKFCFAYRSDILVSLP